MVFTLLIGNNFIYESPRSVVFNNNVLFEITDREDGPKLSSVITDIKENILIKIKENHCEYYNKDLIKKIESKEHILILDNIGNIVFELRIVDKEMIIVSGLFASNGEILNITQNYIVLPSGKWIMHKKLKSGGNNIKIDREDISIF